MSHRDCKPAARERSRRFSDSGARRPDPPPFCKQPVALCPLCYVYHKSAGCCWRLQNWYAGRPRFGLPAFPAANCSQLFLVLSIHYVCYSSLGTSHNVRTGVWLAHKCVPTTYKTWGSSFLFNSNLSKKTKVLERETKLRKINSSYS